MANTEKIQVLERIRQAKDEINIARNTPGMPAGQVSLLETLQLMLRGLEYKIMAAENQESIDAMTRAASELQEVNDQIAQDMAELKAVVDAVEKVAETVGILADILSKALKLIALL